MRLKSEAVMAKNYYQSQAQDDPRVQQDVEHLLAGAPAFQQLDRPTQQALTESLSKITGYLAAGGPAAPQNLALQLAPADDLRTRLGRQGAGQGDQGPDPGPTLGAPGEGGQSTAGGSAGGSGSGGSSGPTGRVGEVARATLNAIDFPTFVAGLIHGTFQAIVDASIQQMEAYAELLKNVAQTVDQFMVDHISDGTARDYLTDRYDGLINTDSSSGKPQLKVNPDASPDGELPGFFKDLGFGSPEDIDDEALNNKVVPAARRMLAEQRQQTLATMVLMGINRIMVDTGEITAKLVFHIDATESTKLRFDQSKTVKGNMAGRSGRQAFSADAIMVNTTNINAQSDMNVRADLTGQVSVKFRSEGFPLERFADSAAIQLINSRAKVPTPAAPAPAATTTAGAPGATPAPAAAAPPAAPTPAAAPVAPSQSLGAGRDPWEPKSSDSRRRTR
jgi:hypothetical protein